MKTPSINSLKRLAAVLALPAISLWLDPQAEAAAFIPGNVVVTQYGDGSAALGATATPVFVLEYLPTTASQALPVQTIAVPTNGGSRLTVAGNSTSEGFITRSLNSTNITFGGYDADAGTAGLAATTGAAVNRLVGQLDFNGNFTRAAGGSTVAFSGSNIRSVISDGSNYWMSGTASSSGTGGGMWYSALGGTPVRVGNGNANGNIRVARIFNGSLFLSTGSGTIGVWAYTGIPTAAATATNMITVATSSPYDFAISPAGNIAYINDDAALVGGGATGGGIQKWTLTGGTWSRSFTMGLSNSLTAGCRGMAVDFSGANPVIYATTADSLTKLIKITDTSVFAAVTNVTDQAITLAIAPASTAFRGVALAPLSSSTATAPSITGIGPSSLITNAGATVTFNLTGGAGFPTASNNWYKIVGTSTNLTSHQIGALTINSVTPSDTASYFVVLTNASGATTSSVVSLTVTAVPTITGISPASVTTNAGSTVKFALTATTGTPAASNFWYKIAGSTTNLIPSATTTTLTLSNVLGGDTAGYFAILTNAFGSATSAVASLTVTGDPNITTQPSGAQGLLDGTVSFVVSAAGTSPGYQWYKFDGVSVYTPLHNGAQGSGSVVSGAATSTLTIANLQLSDPTNFVVVVTNIYGAVTSSAVSLDSVSTHATLAYWDFNGAALNLASPAPYIGSGTASAFNCSTEAGAAEISDGFGFYVEPFVTTNFSWATFNYPATGSNKLCGVQYNVSTLGAKNIAVSYDSRVSPTASDFERLQYTTNGTDWIDFPASSTFNGTAGASGIGNGYLTFNYSLAGFPGVANNPNFSIRVVTEFQSTATYGVGATNNYVGTANTYGSSGTVTYDRVTFAGDAITNNNAPPTISSFMDTNTPDFIPITLNFTVGDDTTSPNSLVCSAVSLNPSKVSPNFSFGGSGVNRTLTITPNAIQDSVDAGPILVTVTDGSGDSTAIWFNLTLTSQNLPPTNSLTLLSATNTLANAPITIPFNVGDDRTSVGGLTYSVSSGNTTLVPNDPVNNIIINGAGTATPTLTIVPATNQLGVGTISVTVKDNDALEAKQTTATIAFMVRPNTNVVAIDYFNYDSTGPLEFISAGYWQHLSGNVGQLTVGAGAVTLDTLDNRENLQAQLLGAPYSKNSNTVLYASFMINMDPTLDPTKMPIGNGSYFALFNDGSGITGNYECRVIAATNDAAPGFYRIGINNFGADATTAEMFPQDLFPNSNYVVVASLVLTNGFSTVWINPASETSPSVTDATPASAATNLFDIADFELRESGAAAGSLNLSTLKIGTTFDSVFPSLHIRPIGTNAVVNWSDPTLGIQSATNVAGPYVDVTGGTPPYTNNASTNIMQFFRFKH